MVSCGLWLMFNSKIIAEQMRRLRDAWASKCKLNDADDGRARAICAVATHPATLKQVRNDLMVKNYWGIKVDLLGLNRKQQYAYGTDDNSLS